jgi:lysophospholipase L1-like esterase
MAVSYEDIVQGAYGSIGRTGIGTGAGTIDQEGYNFWLNALKEGAVTPDQLLANFNQAVAGTIQQQPQAANSQAVAAYIEANPLATQIDPKKVVAVGDSTTWGYNQGNQVAENMVTTAQKALGSDYSVSNLGINSTTAGDFLNSSDFDKALSSGAGTVVLNYGMNEAYRNEDPATFAKNLLTAVQTLQAVGKKVILQTPNSTSSTDAWAQNVGAYADVVRSVSQQTGSTLDDKFTYTSGLSNATSAADPVHPTAATYGLLGTNLADAIKTTTTGVAPKAISVTPPVAAAQTPSLLDNQATAGTVAGATTAPEDIVTKIKNQILAQGTSSQWSGQGLGSPEANAADMARLLSDAGITDIKQFGVIPDLEPVVPIDTLYNGKRVFTQTDEDGKTSSYIYEPTGKTLTYNSTDTGEYTSPEMRVVEVPKDAKLETVYGVARDGGGEYGSSYVPVDQSKIKTVDGKLVGDTGKTTFGNKLTGQAIANNYETGADAFGGTFAGKGNTGYRVEFAPNGTPIFYTTGASSSDAADWMPMVQLALAATGAGGALGSSLLGAGAGQVATNALGNAILGGLTTGIAGGDPLKGALLGGAGGALSGYLQGGPIDASNMTSAQFNDALEGQLIGEMQRSGLTNAQITQFLENASVADISSIVNTIPVTGASDTLLVNAARAPITATDLINTLSQVPTVAITAKTPEQVSPDVINAVNSLISGGNVAPQTVEIKDTRPTQPDIPVITPIATTVTPPPTVTTPSTVTPPTTDVTKKDGSLTPSDVIRILGIGTTIAGINAATGGGGTSGGVQYPIVDVPANWATPPKTSVAPATVLPPINFGDRNLLIGTQWEKFLDPNYGQVPEPIQYSQPSSLSYNDLMGILGSKQGMPSASTLSINDIISGIQNQYGQARTGTMG